MYSLGNGRGAVDVAHDARQNVGRFRPDTNYLALNGGEENVAGACGLSHLKDGDWKRRLKVQKMVKTSIWTID